MERVMIVNTVLVNCDEFNQSYLEPYLDMFSQQVRTILGVPSLEAERVYLETHLALHVSGNTHFYVVTLPHSHILIGAIEIRDPYAYRGQLYCWLHEHYWGSGYFTSAMHLVSQDYFSKTGALFFNALVAIDNKRSYHALKKCGFVDSGYHCDNDGAQLELILRHRT